MHFEQTKLSASGYATTLVDISRLFISNIGTLPAGSLERNHRYFLAPEFFLASALTAGRGATMERYVPPPDDGSGASETDQIRRRLGALPS